jgi:hypothetical protein
LWQILFHLAGLEEKLGRAQRAASLRQEAGQIVSFIADHIVLPEAGAPSGSTGEDERLRRTFLGLPEVRELVGTGR